MILNDFHLGFGIISSIVGLSRLISGKKKAFAVALLVTGVGLISFGVADRMPLERDMRDTMRYCADGVIIIGILLLARHRPGADWTPPCKVPASLFHEPSSVGGMLTVTDKLLSFEPIKSHSSPISIQYSEIAEVSPTRGSGVINNAVLIRTKAGTDYKFVVGGQQSFIQFISKAANLI